MRIKQAGLAVYGFGEQKTPKAFVRACDRFIYTEVFKPADQTIYSQESKNSNEFTSSQNISTEGKLGLSEDISRKIKEAYETVAGDDGKANIGTVVFQIQKLDSSFDARNYGYKKPVDLFKSMKVFEIEDNYMTILPLD